MKHLRYVIVNDQEKPIHYSYTKKLAKDWIKNNNLNYRCKIIRLKEG